MAREKELYRENLNRLDEQFPDKNVLSYGEIAEFTGRSVRFVQKHFKQYKKKELYGVSKTVVARVLS